MEKIYRPLLLIGLLMAVIFGLEPKHSSAVQASHMEWFCSQANPQSVPLLLNAITAESAQNVKMVVFNGKMYIYYQAEKSVGDVNF